MANQAFNYNDSFDAYKSYPLPLVNNFPIPYEVTNLGLSWQYANGPLGSGSPVTESLLDSIVKMVLRLHLWVNWFMGGTDATTKASSSFGFNWQTGASVTYTDPVTGEQCEKLDNTGMIYKNESYFNVLRSLYSRSGYALSNDGVTMIEGNGHFYKVNHHAAGGASELQTQIDDLVESVAALDARLDKIETILANNSDAGGTVSNLSNSTKIYAYYQE